MAHEALIRKWELITKWMAEDREAARLLDEIRKAATLWQRQNKDPSYLYRGARLVRVENFYTNNVNNFTDEETQFISSCIKQRDTDKATAEKKRRRELIQTRIFASILGIALIFATILGFFAWDQWKVAESREGEAKKQ